MTQQEFFDRYKWNGTRDMIGSGGFGKIFKAKDSVRHRRVAIKNAFVTEHKFTLKREVELANEIEPHINVLRYENYYRFELNNEWVDYAIMPFYDHGNLADLIEKNELSYEEKIVLARGILNGVNHLHHNQIIHRDLKPSNILLDRQHDLWIPVLADFGLSRINGNEGNSVANSSVGRSLPYAAPEQLINGGKVSFATDLWALGAIIYELCTGKRAFNSDEGNTQSVDVELFRKITEVKVPEDVSSLPSPFREIVEKCLVKKPSERPSIDALIQLFKPDDDHTVLIKPQSVTRPKPSKRNVALILPLAVMGLALACMFTYPYFKKFGERGIVKQETAIEPVDSVISEPLPIVPTKGNSLRPGPDSKTHLQQKAMARIPASIDRETEAIDVEKKKAENQLLASEKSISKTEDIAGPAETVVSSPETIGLSIKTSKGNSNPVFRSGERMTLYFKVDRPCYVRFVYRQADGSLVLLTNNLHVTNDRIGKWIVTEEFECVPPFGDEELLAFASEKPYEPLGADGSLLQESVNTIKVKTRGMKAAEKQKVASASMKIKTESL